MACNALVSHCGGHVFAGLDGGVPAGWASFNEGDPRATGVGVAGAAKVLAWLVPLTLTFWLSGGSDELEAVETGDIARSSSRGIEGKGDWGREAFSASQLEREGV